MIENIYDYIENNFNVKVENYIFERDYIIKPLQKCILHRGNKTYEYPNENDFNFLYLTLNLSRKQLSQLFNVSLLIINKIIKYYNIKKDSHLSILNRNKTNLEKYGTISPSQLSSIKLKQEQTNLERYGYKSSAQSPYVKEKIEQTNLERYGVKNVFQSSDVKEKIKSSMIKKYGVEYALHSQSLLNKSKNTKKQKYNNEYYTNREKAKQTNLERYGVEYPLQLDCIQKKSSNTCYKKYNNKCFLGSDIHKENSYNYYLKAIETKKKHGSLTSSEPENEIYAFLQAKFVNVQRQWRDANYSGIADFFIPSHKIIIEYQGNWTHGPFINGCHEPFDSTNARHLNTLKYLQSKNDSYYNRVIQQWTVADPNKRVWAKNRPLYHWMEFFSPNDFKNWFNNI